MKKYYRLMIAALSVALVSCSMEKNIEPELAKLGNTLSISAGTDTKTSIGTDGNTLWMSSDTLIVFDQSNVGVKFGTTSSNVASADFTTTGWTGGTPTYACCFADFQNAACTSDGVISVNIPANQQIIFQKNLAKMATASVGIVTGSEGSYQIAEMKNVMGLVKFNFGSVKVAKLVMEAIGGESLCGYIDVNYTKLVNGDADFWVHTAGKTSSSIITITPDGSASDDGCFKASSYYACVIPQFYSQGIRFTLYDKADGIIAVRTVGTAAGLTIVRNQYKELESPMEDILPDTMEIDLNFYNSTNTNPFGFGNLAQADEDRINGDVYSYDYNFTYKGSSYTHPMSFTICRGTQTGSRYRYTSFSSMICGEVGRQVLFFDKDLWWMSIPAVPGHYLKSVTIAHGNDVVKQVQVRSAAAGGGAVYGYTSKAAGQVATSEGPNVQTVTFPNTQVSPTKSTVINTPYYLYGASGSTSMRIYEIKIVYTRTLE